MANTFSHLFIFFLFHSLISSSIASTQFSPKAVALPIIKDSATNQHVINITQRTPFKSIPVTLDLGGPFLWVDCDHSYKSSTYRPAPCGSARCRKAKSKSCSTCNSTPRPGCHNNTCGLNPENPFTYTSTSGDLGSDLVKIRSTDGSSLGRLVYVPNLSFVCAPTFLTKGLAKGAQGIAGLGRTKISLPSQFATAFKFSPTFAVCLSSTTSPGVVIFGDVPYKFVFSPIVIDIRTVFSYTPLLINPVSTAQVSSIDEKSTEFFIGVKSIKINDKIVPINTTLLSFNKNGIGGTKISTIDPYTVLQTSIYKAVTQSFDQQYTSSYMAKRVKGVAPFEICYDPSSLPVTRRGPFGPDIDLVLQNEKVKWRISTSNSLVRAGDAYCLGFIDGGVKTRTAVVIGAFQLQDNLLQFDLVKSRLGFSNALFDQMNRCDNFNFTSSN